jgi:YebC/PmpR family DNA-binding regulatory protein
MSGHSKWATIKHKKGAQDAKRGQLFGRLIKAIEVATREGGGDVKGNPTLATMVQKARDASVPMDNIERAIKRGTGELEGVAYDSITYEGYAPAGVAVLVEVLTDNRNRAAADVRSAFNKNNGNLGEPGSVAWMFTKAGVIIVAPGADEEQVLEAALEAGADDVITDDGSSMEIRTAAGALTEVRAALEAAGIAIESAEVTMIPSTTIPLDKSDAVKVLRLVDALEDVDDVQNVYANFDISEEILAEVG